jgi:integrase/recombinase XerC
MPSSPDSLAEHLDWMRQRGLAASTVYQRRRILTRLAAALPVPLLEATPGMLAGWRAGLAVGDEACAHYVGGAREFYRWAIGEDRIKTSPAAGLPVPRPGRRLPRPIAEDDLFTALAGAPARVRPWLVLAAWAGLRAKEIAYLRRQHVLDTARPPALLIVSEATKGRGERIIPMSAFVLAELAAAGLPRAGWMFARGDGAPGPNAPWTVSGLANRHLHACGSAATLHQCRHRFGTMAYRHRRDLRVVQELLGHSSPQTTAGYAAYDRADAAAAVEALPVPRRLRAVGQ